ncbi:MAG TPA: IS481 family transposase, partial [Candidatus Limnocylindrales bacterium]|nr:IS481 family transposase [Candidatus Limnocylindrales bacterium]
MAHPKARLNVLGRELLVTRVIVMGWPAATAADAQGISRATAYKWVRRFRAEGVAGLADRSSRPHRMPHATPGEQVGRILAARAEWRWGPDRLGPLLGLPASTVAAVLHRERVGRLADLDRPTGLPVRRYEAGHPGELVHQDHKKLGRIPDGGGHRALGRAAAPARHRGLGYDHFEVIVDDRSRRSVVVQVPDESSSSAAAALKVALATFEADGITVERVMTDNAWAYRGREYRAVLGDRRQTRTRPYRPQTNGKAERFIGTLNRERAYARTYVSNAARLAALPVFVDFYNHRRPHTALGGLSPAAVVNNVPG